jgi:hypothetical protein
MPGHRMGWDKWGKSFGDNMVDSNMALVRGTPVAVVLADRLVAGPKNLVDRWRPEVALQRLQARM